MAASDQIVPDGSINHIGVAYMSPYGATTATIFQDAAVSGTEFGAIDFANSRLNIDTIFEFTAANGVNIDSVRCKDGGVRLANNVALSSRNTANNADVDMMKLNTSDQIAFSGTIDASTMTFDSQSDARATMSAAVSGFNGDITRLTACDFILNTGADIAIRPTSADRVYLGTSDTNYVQLDSNDFSPVTSKGANLGTASLPFNGLNVDNINWVQTTSGTAGAVAEYITISVNGTSRKIAALAVS